MERTYDDYFSRILRLQNRSRDRQVNECSKTVAWTLSRGQNTASLDVRLQIHVLKKEESRVEVMILGHL
jgi:hypothetical protein